MCGSRPARVTPSPRCGPMPTTRAAGSYLCNYLSWRSIEATSADAGPRLAAFVHVPPLKRDGASQRKGATRRVTLEELVDAGEAMLLEMVRLTRRACREGD